MKVLFVDCCISQRGRDSRTKRLCDVFLETYTASHPDAEVETVKVRAQTLPPFTRSMLDERDALAAERRFGAPVFAPAWQFAKADRIVVGAPFWDLSFPARLRIYIEHISANGVTYHYGDDGPHGDCRAEKLVYLTSGGDFPQKNSLGVEHWRQLCAMYGIPGFDSVFAGGLDAAPQRAEALLEDACGRARELAGSW